MPRKPTHFHPLRQVREALEKTQAEFAKLIGSSAPTVQAIENGQRPVTLEMAEKIMTITGVWPFSLTEKWEEAVDLTGEPYTRLSFMRFRDGLLEDGTVNDRERIEYALEKVLEAAHRSGKTRLALYYLSKEIATMVERLQLDDALFRVYEEISMKMSPPLLVGDLRKDPGLAKKIGFIDDPSLKDEEKLYPKLTPAHATKRSHLHSRWDHLDVQAPWFTRQHVSSDAVTEESRKIYGSDGIQGKYQNSIVEKHRKQQKQAGT